jgi:Flp pilus assembly protein TadB
MSIDSNDRFETIEQLWQELQDYATRQQAHIPRVTSADLPQALPEHEGERNMLSTKRWIFLPILLALLVTIGLAIGFVSYVWGISILLLLCTGILLFLLLPRLHRR